MHGAPSAREIMRAPGRAAFHEAFAQGESPFDTLRPLVLCEMGHDTTEAASAKEALYLLRKNVGFDLVLSDVVMPGINGIEFAKQAISARSNVKIVLVTGDSTVVDDVVASGALALLNPYCFESLNVIISDAIRSH